MRRTSNARSLSGLILLLASALGAWAFLSPFFAPQQKVAMEGMAHAQDAPLWFVLLLGVCLLMLVSSLETRGLDAQFVAVLGILVGINATLRLVPSIAGFSAVFFLPILCGYVFGADFGFLVGALSLAVSALITGGVGPWLPFQMFAAGWSGMVAGWLPKFPNNMRLQILVLALWGLASGLLFGAVMNLWFWPYLAEPGGTALGWQQGMGFMQTLTRYGIFYVVTSLWWDAARSIGNFLLLIAVGAPLLRLLRRFYQRFSFTAMDAVEMPHGAVNAPAE